MFDDDDANWRSTVNKDLSRMGIIWEEAEVAAQNRSEWRQSVAQCIHLDAGRIKVKVKVKATKWLVFPTPLLFDAPARGNPLEFLDGNYQQTQSRDRIDRRTGWR